VLKGTIISINRSRGYGFIRIEDGSEIFFHQRWLKKVKFRDLSEGSEVIFSINKGPRGPRAYDLDLALNHEEKASEYSSKVAEIFRD